MGDIVYDGIIYYVVQSSFATNPGSVVNVTISATLLTECP